MQKNSVTTEADETSLDHLVPAPEKKPKLLVLQMIDEIFDPIEKPIYDWSKDSMWRAILVLVLGMFALMIISVLTDDLPFVKFVVGAILLYRYIVCCLRE